MRQSRYLLDRDLKDKFAAQSIDEHVIDLSLTNPSLYLKEGVTCIEHRYVTIHFEAYDMEKEEYTDENIKNAEKQRLNAVQLRNIIDGILKKLVDDMKQALEESIKNTEKAIRDKEQYLKLAYTRLDIRHKRSNIELVYDPPQKHLAEEEVREIECEIQKLQERFDESHVCLRNLDRDKLILEKDIETKTNTIFVAEVECHEGLRKSILIEDW
ncbi:unnamed protein product [Adineta steineri]|uniref:Tektin n=1 Tax=Adineta steineri TaxID=433720 RepID=A0A818NV11_9BILA|nr:unnamed protein product [Adineta steineri]CAF3610604.1 unnamed protein product [Adineta steineri]